MKAIKRTDIHRPSAIEPLDYEYVGCLIPAFTIYDMPLALEHEDRVERHMQKTGGKYSDHEHGGTCHICGAGCIYVAVYYHAQSNSYIKTGFDCADKMSIGEKKDFRAIKKEKKSAEEARAGKLKAKAILEKEDLLDAMKVYEEREWVSLFDHRAESVVSDIVGKLIRYGSISEAQIKYVRSSLKYIEKREEIEEQRAKEKAEAKEVPEGRTEIAGTVISLKWKETDFGNVLKMTVKSVDGYVVWGSAPKSLWWNEDEAKRLKVGDQVKFSATLEKSENDSKFGFFKRPSKAEITKRGEAK